MTDHNGPCTNGYLEMLADLEKKLMKQQTDHTQNILHAIDTARNSIEETIGLLSFGHAPEKVARLKSPKSANNTTIYGRASTPIKELPSRKVPQKMSTKASMVGTISDLWNRCGMPEASVRHESCFHHHHHHDQRTSSMNSNQSDYFAINGADSSRLRYGSLAMSPASPHSLRNPSSPSGLRHESLAISPASPSGLRLQTLAITPQSMKATRLPTSMMNASPMERPTTLESQLMTHVTSSTSATSIDFEAFEKPRENPKKSKTENVKDGTEMNPTGSNSADWSAPKSLTSDSADDGGEVDNLLLSEDRLLGGETQSLSRFTIRHFDLCTAVIIFLNFVMVFVQMEFESAEIAVRLGKLSDLDPHQRNLWLFACEVLEHIFAGIFILELLIRMAMYRVAFFRSPVNVVDGLIVVWTSFNLYILRPASSSAVNLSYLRLFRACTVVWTLRVIHKKQIFENLRILMRAISSSIIAILWSMVVFGLVMVFVSIFISQSFNSFFLSHTEDLESQKRIFDLYGSSSRSLYTLFLVIFCDGWQTYVEPLKKDVSTFHSIIFVASVLFAWLGMLHMIGALFVKDTLRIAAYDSELMRHMNTKTKARLISLFEAQDVAGEGRISLAQLNLMFADSNAKKCLSSLGFSIHEIELLFSILQDGDGQVDCVEIVDSMMQVKGQVQSMDSTIILKRSMQILEYCQWFLTEFHRHEENQTSLAKRIEALSEHQREFKASFERFNRGCPVCARTEKIRMKRRLMGKLKMFLRLMKKKTERLGRTLLCHTYQDYLFYRLRDQTQYNIELQNDHVLWAKMFETYKIALLALPSSNHWDDVYWIGSSAVPDLVSKPIIDIMITTGAENLKEIVHAICLETTDELWLSTHAKGLQFPIGFYMEGWGFLQMPHYQASINGLVECNVHIFYKGTKAANEKLMLVRYLTSSAGKEFKDKYSILKLSLELRYKAGQLDSANYNKEKNFLIAQMLEAAAAWDATRSQEGPDWDAAEFDATADSAAWDPPPPATCRRCSTDAPESSPESL